MGKKLLTPIKNDDTDDMSLSIAQDEAGDYVESSFQSRQQQKSREFSIKRIKYANPSATASAIRQKQLNSGSRRMLHVPSVRKMHPNPSTKELHDLYLP